MSFSEQEISRITEIVVGRMGASLDAKALRRVIDSVVDSLKQEQKNPSITNATCAASSRDQSTLARITEPGSEASGLYNTIAQGQSNRVIVAAFGKNRPGVVAAITKVLAELHCNIEDISQTIMQDFFSMIMIVDINDCKMDFALVRDRIKDTETQLGMKVFIMHEDIFRYMHRI
jgi:ACT domain-containing protein